MLTNKSQSNEFTNEGVEHWMKWILRRHDWKPFATVYFLSRRNPTSPRLFPLLNNSRNFRIILIRGFRFGKLDHLLLYFHKLFVFAFADKLSRYRLVAATSFESAARLKTNVLVHLDDPEYSAQEKGKLIQLERECKVRGFRSLVICTNAHTRKYLYSFLDTDNIIEAPQGYTKIDTSEFRNDMRVFRIVYSSSIIDIADDGHEGHSSWDASHLVNELIPKILLKHPDVEIHLIGRVGKNAMSKLNGFKQVTLHGFVSVEENARILSTCHLAIYPRQIDNLRSVQKISEYIGAGLPIVSYDVVDASLVKSKGFGLTVESADDFVGAIAILKRNRLLYNRYVEHIVKARSQYTWNQIARNLEEALEEKLMKSQSK